MTCRAGWTRLHRLNACWIMLCILCMLFSCAVILVPVFVQRSSELRLYVLALSRVNLQITTALGATALGVLLVGLCGYCMGLKSSSPLSDRLMTTFSWLLVCTICFTILSGTLIWFVTLQERANFAQVWTEQSPAARAWIQDTLQCCGYWEASASGATNGGACSSGVACVGPLAGAMDVALNLFFTLMYGFAAVQALLFLATVCIVIARRQQVRLENLDRKRWDFV